MTTSRNSAVLRYMLGFIGIVQVFFGLVFTFAPNSFAQIVGLQAAPAWAQWMFILFGARAFGFAFGMFTAMRDPARHTTWIRAMIGVQVVDWLGTVVFLVNGSLTLMQVSTAAVLPVIFIAVLVGAYPRESVSSPHPQQAQQ